MGIRRLPICSHLNGLLDTVTAHVAVAQWAFTDVAAGIAMGCDWTYAVTGKISRAVNP